MDSDSVIGVKMPAAIKRVHIPPPCDPFLRSITEVEIQASGSEAEDENEEGKDWRRELRLEKTKMNLRRWKRSRERSKVKEGKGSYVVMKGEGGGWLKKEDSEELAGPGEVGILKKADPEKREVVVKFGCQEVTFQGFEHRVGVRIPRKVEKYYRGIYNLYERRRKLLDERRREDEEMDVEEILESGPETAETPPAEKRRHPKVAKGGKKISTLPQSSLSPPLLPSLSPLPPPAPPSTQAPSKPSLPSKPSQPSLLSPLPRPPPTPPAVNSINEITFYSFGADDIDLFERRKSKVSKRLEMDVEESQEFRPGTPGLEKQCQGRPKGSKDSEKKNTMPSSSPSPLPPPTVNSINKKKINFNGFDDDDDADIDLFERKRKPLEKDVEETQEFGPGTPGSEKRDRGRQKGSMGSKKKNTLPSSSPSPPAVNTINKKKINFNGFDDDDDAHIDMSMSERKKKWLEMHVQEFGSGIPGSKRGLPKGCMGIKKKNTLPSSTPTVKSINEINFNGLGDDVDADLVERKRKPVKMDTPDSEKRGRGRPKGSKGDKAKNILPPSPPSPPSLPPPPSPPSLPPPPSPPSPPSVPSPPTVNFINETNFNGFGDDDDADIDLFADGSADDLLMDLSPLPSTSTSKVAPVSIPNWRR